MNEPEVVQRVHRFLSTRGLNGEPMSRLFTDPHPTLTGMSALRPFQRFAIGDEGFVHHPDLLGQQSDSDSLVAVEADYADSDVAGICRLRRRRRQPSAGRITPTLKWPDYAGR